MNDFLPDLAHWTVEKKERNSNVRHAQAAKEASYFYADKDLGSSSASARNSLDYSCELDSLVAGYSTTLASAFSMGHSGSIDGRCDPEHADISTSMAASLPSAGMSVPIPPSRGSLALARMSMPSPYVSKSYTPGEFLLSPSKTTSGNTGDDVSRLWALGSMGRAVAAAVGSPTRWDIMRRGSTTVPPTSS
jgi:hypothetical protein